MHVLGLLLALFAAPFWESKAPPQWSEEELKEFLSDSPWAQLISDPAPGVLVFLASARPMEEAELEFARRNGRKAAWTNEDYSDYLRENQGKCLVLAIPYSNLNALADAEESRRMEEECILKVGHKKFKITGHFPPVPSDPYLRLIYPRAVGPADKAFSFELYLPGVVNPYRRVEFRVKDLYYKGRLEM